jgi:hypothetical protein
MYQLVNKDDLDEYKYVADSVKNTETWPQFVSEAQMLDVKNWLGDALLLEIVGQAQTSPSSLTAKNELLLNGGSYEYGGRNYHFQGLKAAIIYYAFGRFTNRSSVNYTAAGIVIKESDFSNPVSDKMVQRLETEARLTAEAIRDEVVRFLNRKKDDYPLWRGCYNSQDRTRTFKVIGD